MDINIDRWPLFWIQRKEENHVLKASQKLLNCQIPQHQTHRHDLLDSSTLTNLNPFGNLAVDQNEHTSLCLAATMSLSGGLNSAVSLPTAKG